MDTKTDLDYNKPVLDIIQDIAGNLFIIRYTLINGVMKVIECVPY